MRKSFSYLAAMLIASIFSIAVHAQTITVSGNVKNQVSSETLPAVSVTVKGGTSGIFTDDKGHFKLSTTAKFPLTLVISSIGFESKEVIVNSANDVLSIALSAVSILGQEIVVSASRVPERIIESPVTIERMSASTIRQSAAPNFYEAIANIRGVDMITSSMTFRTVGTRGFNASGNSRFNQFLDEMDNQAPGLNFSVGNFLGINELDVDNVELLPGASSALYGSGGMSGTMLMTSKNPFKYQGFSYQIKQGVNHTDAKQRKSAPYYDWSMRWGKVINDKLAFKIAAQFMSAQDWQGQDYRNFTRNSVTGKWDLLAGNRSDRHDYNGVNVYGDDIKAPMMTVFNAMAALGLFGTSVPTIAFLRTLIPVGQEVSRTGYLEKDLTDNNVQNFKVNGGVFYKIKPNVEASLVGFWGTGNTVYTGGDRYVLKDVKMGQYKAEIKAKNWFVRAYTTQEDAGQAFALNLLAVRIEEATSNNSSLWFPTYIGNFAAARAQIGLPEAAAHVFARNAADATRKQPGSSSFNSELNRLSKLPISKGGARFIDKSALYVYEGQYNLSSLVKVVDLLIGANFKQYSLFSEQTLFDDAGGRIKINEQGAYIQMQKKFLDDKLKLTASGRYDKHQNFEGRFTPRVSAMYTFVKDNNLRVSYQTGYRFPTTQNQYIDLLIPGSARLIGGLPHARQKYNFAGNPVYTEQSFGAFVATYSSRAPIVGPGQALTEATALLRPYQEAALKPESVNSYEIGYRGIVAKKFFVDAYWYQSTYSNFLSGRNFIQSNPLSGPTNPAALLTNRNVYQFSVNVPGSPKAEGFGIGVDYNVYKGFVVKVNYATDTLKFVPVGFITFFNTPRHRTNIGISNADAYKGFGFNVMFRRQSSFEYQTGFAGGIMPAYETIDAQVSYRLPKTKNMIKVGGSNITNKYYISGIANPAIGALYYVSYGYNIF